MCSSLALTEGGSGVSGPFYERPHDHTEEKGAASASETLGGVRIPRVLGVIELRRHQAVYSI